MANGHEPEDMREKIIRIDERQKDVLRRLEHLESRPCDPPGVGDRLTAELTDLKKSHQSLKSDYDKMVSRSAGVFVAVLSIGGLVGWVISQIKDFFLRSHS